MNAELKFHEGDEVRALVTDRDSNIHEGQTYVVEFAYDDLPDTEEPLYSLQHTNGMSSGMEALESQLELTRSHGQMLARRIPTKQAILRAVPIGWDWGDDLNINESDLDGDDAIELYGKTAEGLPFGFRLRVESVWQTDF